MRRKYSLTALMESMNPGVGNLSWVSHHTLAKQLGIHHKTVARYLRNVARTTTGRCS